MTVVDLFASTRDRLLSELAELPGHALIAHTTPTGARRWVLYEPGHPGHPDRNDTT